MNLYNPLMVICGLDECGRGSLAGPLVAGGVIFLKSTKKIVSLLPAPLRDSKKMTEIQRLKIYEVREGLPIIYLTESIGVDDINTRGITWANKEVFLRLTLKMTADKYLIDGNIRFDDPKMESVVRGDDLYPQIMLASILAKVERDLAMTEYHKVHPQYNWANNSGYGTREHLYALKNYGLSPLHRKMFANSALSKVH